MTYIFVRLNLEGFGLQIGNQGTASDFTWTLGSRPCFRTSGNPRRFGIPHSRPAVRFGANYNS